jgi:hypothetical protein
MNQFYTLKSLLMRIGFLERDSHFAFNLSNVQGFKEAAKRQGIMKDGNICKVVT